VAKQVNDHEFAAVSALDGPARYSHFIGQIADWKEVWSLKSANGWILAGAMGGQVLIPVWPHERYAAACAIGEWSGATAHAIPLHDWMEKWLPGITRDHRGVAVFPSPNDAGIIVSTGRLADDLTAELEKYGD